MSLLVDNPKHFTVLANQVDTVGFILACQVILCVFRCHAVFVHTSSCRSMLLLLIKTNYKDKFLAQVLLLDNLEEQPFWSTLF